MADHVENVTVDILRSIQKSISEMRASIEQRLDRLEAGAAKQRRDNAGLFVMAKATVGDLAGEVAAMKARMTVVEQQLDALTSD